MGLKRRRLLQIFGGLVAGLILVRWIPGARFEDPYSAALFARDGQLLSAKIANDGQWRFPPMQKVPSRFAVAVLHKEDQRFFWHLGVDPFAIARAVRQNAAANRVRSGGSTITMQVIRLARRNPPRTYVAKLFETLLAIHLELKTSKQAILALYASHAPFGGNVVGLEAASWRYFGRRPDDLTWAENCLLAVLPNSPGLIHPGRSRDLLRAKRDGLLRNLQRAGHLSELDLALALQEPIPAAPRPVPRLAPHLLESLASEARSRRQDPRFLSTVDRDLQRSVQDLVERKSKELAKQAIRNAAVLVIDNTDMSVRAYVGNSRSTDFDSAGYAVDLIQRPRSTGSILKPILYALMLQAGDILPTTLVLDTPARFGGFIPENFDRNYRGAVPAREALARSLNIPAVRLLRDYGIARFYDILKNMGMTTLMRLPNEYGLSLILGGAEGTPWDLASMYANLARIVNEGLTTQKGTYATVRRLANEPLEKKRRLDISAGAAWLTLQALLEVRRPEEEGAWKNFSSARWVAWKTGTSFGQRDAWAIGVTPRYTVAVWAGNASGEGRPDLTGSVVAGPILFDVMSRLGNDRWFTEPVADLQMMDVCRDDGFLRAQGCATEIQMSPKNSHFEQSSPYHRTIHFDAKHRRVHGQCESASNMTHQTWFVLPAAAEYYYRRQNPLYKPLPPLRADCVENAGSEETQLPMALLYPYPDSKLFIPTELGARRERTVFEAVHRRYDAILYWHMDGRFLGSTRTFHKRELDIPVGAHQLTVVDQFGNHITRKFEVLGR